MRVLWFHYENKRQKSVSAGILQIPEINDFVEIVFCTGDKGPGRRRSTVSCFVGWQDVINLPVLLP